jgi:hypothetical protein
MRRRFMAVALMALGVSVACATTDVMRLDTQPRPPTNPAAVRVLLDEPQEPYRAIAMIHTSDQGWGLSLENLKTSMVQQAAAIGGHAVIIGQASQQSGGTMFIPIGTTTMGLDMPTKLLTGKVIVFEREPTDQVKRPTRPTPAEFPVAQKTAEPAGVLSRAEPKTAPRAITQKGEASATELRALAGQGDATAQYRLGVMYAAGRDVPQDFGLAVEWTRKAAQQGHVEAQFNLGVLYALGQGVPQSIPHAVAWYRIAAEKGHAEALFSLGNLYASGRGVLQDDVQAHMWLNLAASRTAAENQATYAKDRDMVAARMTPDQRAEAQKLAREWAEAFDKRQRK